MNLVTKSWRRNRTAQARSNQPDLINPAWITKEINKTFKAPLHLSTQPLWKPTRVCMRLTDYTGFSYIRFHVRVKELFWREEREDGIEVIYI